MDVAVGSPSTSVGIVDATSPDDATERFRPLPPAAMANRRYSVSLESLGRWGAPWVDDGSGGGCTTFFCFWVTSSTTDGSASLLCWTWRSIRFLDDEDVRLSTGAVVCEV